MTKLKIFNCGYTQNLTKQKNNQIVTNLKTETVTKLTKTQVVGKLKTQTVTKLKMQQN